MDRQVFPAEEREIVLRLREIGERVAESALKSGRHREDIQIMAVTKKVRPELVNFAWEQGNGLLTLLGENRVQEYLGKRNSYCVQEDRIHMIGHLQSNKVKYIIDKVSMIESVSSMSLAEEINRRAGAAGLTMDILLEINIASEETKSGFLEKELFAAVEGIFTLPSLRLRGLMCIPQKERGEYYFAKTESLLQELRTRKPDRTALNLLSMGMSADYEQAIRFGANIVRLGSAIFSERKIRNGEGQASEA